MDGWKDGSREGGREEGREESNSFLTPSEDPTQEENLCR